MGSHGSCFGGGKGSQEPKYGALSRQGSLYNLTLDEVQNHLGDLGKPMSSINLDELLKSVLSDEANQGTGGIDYGPITGGSGQLASILSLNRQSSLTLTGDSRKKTVNELYQDIKEGNTKDRQPTLGEMTLEDFLVKAGVVAESAIPPQTIVPPPQQQGNFKLVEALVKQIGVLVVCHILQPFVKFVVLNGGGREGENDEEEGSLCFSDPEEDS